MLIDFLRDPVNNASFFVTGLITLIVAFTIHEFCHAFVADRFGDPTPRTAGRLTLNPLAHLDVFGTLAFLLMSFGWAKPVPVNPYQLGRKSSAAMMLVSLAGPASNFILAALAAIPLRLGLVQPDLFGNGFLPTLGSFLFYFAFFNLILTFFNLIPLAPLDGEKIAEYFFPPPLVRVLDAIRPYSMFILLLLFFVLPYLGFDFAGQVIFTPVMRLAMLMTGV